MRRARGPRSPRPGRRPWARPRAPGGSPRPPSSRAAHRAAPRAWIRLRSLLPRSFPPVVADGRDRREPCQVSSDPPTTFVSPMEASEKPQLPLDDAPEGAVRALDDRILIERLTVQDERAAQLVRERQAAGQQPAKTVADAIEIGARVLDREDAAAEVDYVKAEFERQASALRERLTRSLEAGDQQLADRITKAFDSDDGSVPREFQETLQRELAEQRQALLKQFSAEDGANPLTDFKGGVVNALKELGGRYQSESEANRKRIEQLTREIVELKQQDEADRRVAEAEEAGTRKGRSFEELVHEEFEALAAAQDDVAHHVGDSSSESGGKKGDSVIELGACNGPPLATVVVEAKNRALSKNEAWAELNAAITERDADYGVLVVAGEDKVPKGLEELAEYQGNKMIVVLDRDEPDPLALRLVYRYMRARVLASQADGLQADAAGVRAAAEDARARLKNVNKVRKSLTSITNSADRARDDVDEMVEGVELCIGQIESLISAAEPEDD